LISPCSHTSGFRVKHAQHMSEQTSAQDGQRWDGSLTLREGAGLESPPYVFAALSLRDRTGPVIDLKSPPGTFKPARRLIDYREQLASTTPERMGVRQCGGMPKRSNDFQRMIRRIYSQTRSRGATVTESAVLPERGSGVEREVDVLIEFRTADVDVRIGVECRDQKRMADIQWIDSLIGKYENLPVHRVVAVSRSGFTKAAERKAAEKHIETRTLRHALSIDWPKELLEPFLARVTVDIRILAFVPYSSPKWPHGVLPRAVWTSGQAIAVDRYFAELIDGMRRQVGPHLMEVKRLEFQRLSDFRRKFELIFRVKTPDTIFVAPSGDSHRAEETYVRCEVQLGYVALPVQRHLLGSIGITTAVDANAEHGPVTLTIAQEPGGPLPLPTISYPGEPDDEPPPT
jgi:hypothetical protein